MQLFAFLFRQSRWLLVTGLIASLVSGFGSALMISFINDALSASGSQLTAVGIKFAAVALVVLLTRWASETMFVHLSQRTLASMRIRLSQLMLEVPYRHIETQGSARLLAVLTDDVRTVSDFFVGLPNLSMNGAVVVGCLAYLGMLSWQVFVFAVVVTFLGAFGYLFAHARALGHLRKARIEQDELFKHFRALCDGAKELRLHRPRRGVFLAQLLGRSVEGVRAHYTRGMTIYAASESWGNFLLFVFIGLVLFVVGRLVTVEAAVMSGYALVFLHMLLPLDAVLMAIPNINRTRVALERVDAATAGLIREDGSLGDVSADADEAPSGPFESVKLAGVTHSYHREKEDRSFVLGPIDLELRPGEIVFLIGGNGSGKTTLAKLIVGLYAPEAGEIQHDGRAVGDADRDGYRQLFSAVFSDFFLFERLIGLGGPAGGTRQLDADVQDWLRELQLDRKVTVSDGVLSTTELSQGQRKRLALLVAYLEDRPIYVFDEWAADQDPAYKQIFYTRLLPDLRARGKAVLVISHDDRYFHVADRCVELEAGQLRGLPTGSTTAPPR